MKPTDEERREVAENLRTMCCLGCRYTEQFYELLNETVMREWDFHSFQDVADRLADLIEPGEPKAMCVAEVKVDGELLEKLAHDTAVELTGIDRAALLALADEIDDADVDGLVGWGDRIRKACGESRKSCCK